MVLCQEGPWHTALLCGASRSERAVPRETGIGIQSAMQDEETMKPRTTALNPAYHRYHMPLKAVVRAFGCRFRLLPRRRKPCLLWFAARPVSWAFLLRQNSFAPFKLHARMPSLLATVEMERGGEEAIACSESKIARFVQYCASSSRPKFARQNFGSFGMPKTNTPWVGLLLVSRCTRK